MTQHKKMKKVKFCGCLDWLFARREHRSPPDDLDSFVDNTKHAGAQDDAGEQGQASLSLVCLKNTPQPLPVVEEELPPDTRDADGGVGRGGEEATGRRPQTFIITIHLVKREKAIKQVEETVAGKDWTQKESLDKRTETLTITLLLVKREKMKEVHEELPSEHHCTAGDAPSSISKAITDAPKETLKSSFEKQKPAKKIVRFNFQNLNSFVKDRELYCGYDYCKYGFPLSMIRSELQNLKERAVRSQEEPAKEALNKLPQPQKAATEEATDAYNKNTEPQHLTGILKKGKTASAVDKCLRFNFQNLDTFVKDRELYCDYDYFKYGVPLSSIRSELQEPKERTVGAPRHLGRPTQRSNDSYQQSKGRNAAHNNTNSRHSQHRHHNSSSHVSHRYETRYFYGGQKNPGPNSRRRSRVKRGAKPSDGEFL